MEKGKKGFVSELLAELFGTTGALGILGLLFKGRLQGSSGEKEKEKGGIFSHADNVAWWESVLLDESLGEEEKGMLQEFFTWMYPKKGFLGFMIRRITGTAFRMNVIALSKEAKTTFLRVAARVVSENGGPGEEGFTALREYLRERDFVLGYGAREIENFFQRWSPKGEWNDPLKGKKPWMVIGAAIVIVAILIFFASFGG